MSESDEHRSLVLGVRDELCALYPGGLTLIDFQRMPGDEVPPLIGGFRPDVFIRNSDTTIIADAKTASDLGRVHTYDQVASFINYLETTSAGVFVLSVTGPCADLAKTVLRFVSHETKVAGVRVGVFDECDLWLLDPNGVTWHVVGP